MCGIVGIVHRNGEPVSQRVLERMTDAIAHRGPDGQGWAVCGPVGLGNRRLAIIDLSDAAKQPIANEAGDVVVTYNGELYNFRELRATLQQCGHTFRSRTDSEVVVHAYEEWGERCVERFNGMFAFAVHDRRGGAHRVFLARDRYGVKPLYYTEHGSRLIFGSEVKALLAHPDVSARPSYAGMSEYFTFQNIFSDLTLFEGVRLLPPAHTLTVCARAESGAPKTHAYWDYSFDGTAYEASAEDAAVQVRELLTTSVTRQLVADVPVGAYLSGGIDSSAIVGVAAPQIPHLHTFTGGFDLSSASGLELAFDERPASEMLSNLFKTEHYEVVLHAGDMERVLPDLVWHLEDLRVGQSYPNFYVARLASKFVKVALSGSGGDELFAGYPWRYYRGIGAETPQAYYDAYYDYWQRLVPDQDRSRFFNPATWAQVRQHAPREVFRSVFDGHQPPLESPEDFVNASLYFESKTFLHGLLIVEDKLSMAHGLETRVPFLDNDLVDFALRLPPRLKLRDLDRAQRVDENEPGKFVRYKMDPAQDGKVILRDALRQFMPAETVARRKQGFSAPDASWFAGESIDYVNRLLCSRDARVNEFLSAEYVRRVIEEHSSGKVNHRLLIWSLLSFEWWCRLFLDGERVA